MKAKDFNLHVKCQDVAVGSKYGTSWIFQCQGFSYDKEIFDQVSPNQHVAFVSLNLKEKLATIQAITKLSFLHDTNQFKDPAVHQLRGIKKAVYLENLQKHPESLWSI